MKSGMVLTGRDGCTATTRGPRIADEVEVEVVEQGSIDCRRGIGTKKRVTVRRGAYDCLSGDIAGGSRPILDDKRLTESRGQRLAHQAHKDVRPATRCIPNDAAHWTRRIGLRASETGDGRHRGGARGQM